MRNSNSQPLVSVLMTVYNRAKFISDAIESVLASSYLNYELIVVDDCSSDGSVELARKFENKDSRIKVYANSENLGDYPNRNKAADYAKGKYIKYLDADDLIYWYGLEVMIESMERFPDAAVGLCHSKTDDLIPYPIQVTPKLAYREHFNGTGLFNYGPSALIIRKDIFDNENGFKEERYLGDGELLLRLGSKYPTVKMAPGLVWWRQHEDQEIYRGIHSGYYLINTYKLNLSYLTDFSPLSQTENEFAIKRQKQHHARKILALIISGKKPGLAWRVFKESQLSFWELLKGFRAYQ